MFGQSVFSVLFLSLSKGGLTMEWKGLPLVIFGSKSNSKEVFNLIQEINRYNGQPVYQMLGFVEYHSDSVGNDVIGGYSIVVSDDNFSEFARIYPILGVVIPQADGKIKSNIFRNLSGIKNLVYPNLIHPEATIGSYGIHMGVGNIFTAGCKVTCDIKFGNFNLINTNATIGHDVTIGSFCTINPNVSISGAANLEEGCLIGSGAVVLQKCTVGKGAIVGAGAVVTKNVEAMTTVVGVPAKCLQRTSK